MSELNEAKQLSLPAKQADVIRLLQVSDCHILESADARLRGMNTRASFEAVCRQLAPELEATDLLLATGDLAQDESVGAYQYLAGQFAQLQTAVAWLPGNHDDSSLMQQHLRGDSIFAAKQICIGGWVIVLLDSTIAGETGGHLAPSQIEFLQTSLADHRQSHVLVCLHHQAIPCGSEWLDQLGLQPPQQLADIVKTQANVRGVLWGHVHQRAEWYRDNIKWMSTPSTCMQFKPGNRTFALDSQTPGYRSLELHADGRIATAVQRIEDRNLVSDLPPGD